MAGRINTTKMLSNETYYNGGMDMEAVANQTISLSPMVSDQYEYSVTEDPIMLQDRIETNRVLYTIFMESPFRDDYIKWIDPKDYKEEITDEDKRPYEIKIPKEDISKVFYYMRDHLTKVKKLSAFEMVIAINEFFEFNYEYIVKRVLSSKMMAEILEDYYLNMGMADRIDEQVKDQLF